MTDDTTLKLKGDTYRETVELSESHFESKGCVMGREKKREKNSRNGRGADEMKFCVDPARRHSEEQFLHGSCDGKNSRLKHSTS